MNLKNLRSKNPLIPPHHSTNIEIQKNYQNEPRFNGIGSLDNLGKNLDEYSNIGLDIADTADYNQL